MNDNNLISCHPGSYCEEAVIEPTECKAGTYMPYGVDTGTGDTVGENLNYKYTYENGNLLTCLFK